LEFGSRKYFRIGNENIMETDTAVYRGDYQIVAVRRNYMTGVLGWMCGALILTGLIAEWVVTTPVIIHAIINNQPLFIVLFIIEVFMVAGMTFFLRRISVFTAFCLFICYAMLNGVTLSALFYIFTASSLSSVFYITAATFGITGLYGYFTHKNMSRLGNVLGLAFVGVIVASLVNYMMHNPMFFWLTSYAGVILFTLLTVYDTQKIRLISESVVFDRLTWQKSAVIGALVLYLDLVNLFLFFLRIFGGKR